MTGEIGSSSFVSTEKLAKAAGILLGICIIIDVAAVWSGYSEIKLLEKIMNGALVFEEEAEANDMRQAMIGLAQLAVLIATAIVFLKWLHRSHKNLPALGAEGLKFTPGWAVGWWFIPFLNLVRPYQVVQEVWKASDPAHERGLSWQGSSNLSLIGLWWGTWLIANMVGSFAGRMAFRGGDSISNLITSGWVTVAADFLEIPAAILAIQVVRRITERQFEKSSRTAMVPPPLT